jgi:HEAT repeat protein/PBS lyase HEAT-like repeat-containing protein
MHRLTIAWCAVLLLAAPVSADVIHLRSGKIEGKIIEKANGRVKIRTTSGIITTVSEKDILAVESRDTARDVYTSMAAKLKPNDTAGHFALASWCRDHGLKDEAVSEFVAVLKFDTNHAEARKKLGYVKTEHGWLTREQAMRARGMVLVNGHWVLEAEAERRAKAERSRKLTQWLKTIVLKLHSAPKSGRPALEAKLAAFDKREAAKEVAALLLDRTARVRRAACASLGKMKLVAAIPRLTLTALTDSDEDVRAAALEAASQTDRDKTTERLYLFITGLKLQPIKSARDQRALKRHYRRIALALGQIGDLRSVPALIQILYPKIAIAGSGATGVGGVRNMGITRSSGGPTAVDVTSGGIDLGRAEGLPRKHERYYFNQAAEDVLKKLTGEDLGVLPRDWQKWWTKHGAARLRKLEADSRADDGKIDKLLEGADREPK